jgi:hypothetical protein
VKLKKPMTATEKYILNTYSNLIDGLKSISKIELIEKLAKLLKRGRIKKSGT